MTDATNGEALFHHLPDNERSALLWLLWHHQGASSEIGQTIRGWLGMRQFERINDAAVEQCKRVEALLTQPTASAGMVAGIDALDLLREFCAVGMCLAADSWDGVEDAYRYRMEHAMSNASLLLAAHESQQKPRVNVGTIGHVSRDKSTLVAALTKVVSPPADTTPDVSERGQLPPIETDVEYDRHYIPLPGGWEIQTKGKGSSFRLCDTKSGRRMVMTGHHFEHEELERMAREIHAAVNMSPPADTTPDVSERQQVQREVHSGQSGTAPDNQEPGGARPPPSTRGHTLKPPYGVWACGCDNPDCTTAGVEDADEESICFTDDIATAEMIAEALNQFTERRH